MHIGDAEVFERPGHPSLFTATLRSATDDDHRSFGRNSFARQIAGQTENVFIDQAKEGRFPLREIFRSKVDGTIEMRHRIFEGGSGVDHHRLVGDFDFFGFSLFHLRWNGLIHFGRRLLTADHKSQRQEKQNQVFHYLNFMVGNKMISRMLGRSVRIITMRSIPMPTPPVGGMPVSMA